MKTFLLALFLAFSVAGYASPIQVPDGCAGQVSPCLIRAGAEGFSFKVGGLQVKVLPQSIVKIISSKNSESFELHDGRLHISATEEWASSSLVINQLVQSEPGVLISRQKDQLKIMRLRDFTLTEYRMRAKSEPQELKSGFANKKDFIHFTKYFFQQAAEFKAFLNRTGKSWKSEFARQNEDQTKVLRRGIASVEEQKRQQEELDERNAVQSKKVRDQFFYRTFHR